MKINEYDQRTAERLVPLLRSIVGEICERRAEIGSLRQRLRALDKLGDRGWERTDAQARLSMNRRELRTAQKELARLGCELDPFAPTHVRIRGEGTGPAGGRTWVVDACADCDTSLRLAS